MKSLPIQRPTLDDPLYGQKPVFQTLMMFAALFSSFPALGGEPGSQLLKIHLSTQANVIWGLGALAGAVLALLGEFWPGHTWTALALERTGCILVGGTALMYATVAFTAADSFNDIRYFLGVELAFAASCLWRAFQCSVRLRYLSKLRAEVSNGIG